MWTVLRGRAAEHDESSGSAAEDPVGRSDLQGIWSNQSPTPVERLDALAGKATLSEAEAAEFERTSLERLLTTFAREVPISGELNGIWLETAKGKVPPGLEHVAGRRPAGRKIPYTPEGRTRWTRAKLGQPMRANVPEDRTEAERCITTDGFLIPNPFYNNYFQIVQAPGHVAIVTEMMHEPRVIPLAGVLTPARTCACGWAIHEGGGKARPWSWKPRISTTRSCSEVREQLHLVERFTRLDADTIQYRLTVTDSAMFARPWTLVNGLRRSDSAMTRSPATRATSASEAFSPERGPRKRDERVSVRTAARAG